MPYVPPDVWIEFAPGFSPTLPPDGGDWVPQRANGETRLRELNFQRGRQDDLDTFEAGTATFTLDNTDGAYDAAVAGSELPPWTPVRIRITSPDTSPTVTRWAGFTEDGAKASGGARSSDATVEFSAVDWMGWVATQPIPESLWGSWVASAQPRPSWWLRGEMSTDGLSEPGEGVIYDSIGGRHAIVDRPDVWQETETIMDGWSWHQTVGRAYTPPDDPLPITATCGAVGWFFTMSPGPTSRWLLSARRVSESSAILWGIRLNTSGHLVAEVRHNNNIVASSVVTANHANGQPHWFRMLISATTVTVQSDLGNGAAVAWGGTINPLGGGILTTGPPDIQQDNITRAEFAYYGSLPPLLPTTLVERWLEDHPWLGVWYQQTVAQRAAAVMRMARPGAVATEIHTSSLDGVLTKYEPSGTAAEAINKLSDQTLGGAWMTREGVLRFRTFRALSDGNYLAHYQDTAAHLTDEDAPSLPGGADPVRYSAPGTGGARWDRVVNHAEVRGRSLALEVFHTATDDRSYAQYGEYRRTFETGFAGVDGLADLAMRVVAERGEPAPEIATVTIEPWGDDAATKFVVDDLELERMVRYTEHTALGGVRYDDAPMQIQSESWSWTGGSDWTVDLTLSPGVVHRSRWPQEIRRDNPTAFWRFGEPTGGVLTDDMGHHHGTIYGAPTVAPTGALVEYPSTALTFDGANDYALTGDLGSFGDVMGEEFTIEAWFRTDVSSRRMVLCGAVGPSGSALWLVLNSGAAGGTQSNVVGLYIGSVSGPNRSARWNTPGLANGNWHHLAIVVRPADGTWGCRYDGVNRGLEGDAPLPMSATWGALGAPLAIGAHNNNGSIIEHFEGDLDELVIYRHFVPIPARVRHYDSRLPT